MGFLFPLFLLAGLALVIPVLIHLFNLRRYKHAYFTNLRFLRALQLSSKRMGNLQKKLLLLSRLLFLAALVLAFAQPVIRGGEAGDDAKALHVLYLDNSPSMLVKSGQQTLFDRAKEKARYLVEALPEESRFAVLTNDRGGPDRQVSGKEALAEIDRLEAGGRTADIQDLLGKLQLRKSGQHKLRVYLFSDFQERSFLREGMLSADATTTFFCFPFTAPGGGNLFFDTVFLNDVRPGSRQPVSLTAQVKSAGSAASSAQRVSLWVNGSLKGGFALRSRGDSVYADSLSFQPSGRDWERLELIVDGDAIGFDDTFRLALKSDIAFEVLVHGDVSPYLATAFSTFPGFTLQTGDVPAPELAERHPASLLILPHAGRAGTATAQGLKAWLESGRNLLIFPGPDRDKSALNTLLSQFVPLAFGEADTALQEVVKLESGHPLVYDLFERIPDNVTLPAVKLHFPVEAGFGAAEQVLMRFRNGSPFLAQYQVGRGKLFVCASPLGPEFSDFPLSYFFAPLLYKMAMPSGGGMVFATTTDRPEPVWISSRHFDKRGVWHARRGAYTFVPPQRMSGAGMDLFLGGALPGFYELYQEGNQDTFLVAVNGNPDESQLEPVSREALAEQLAPATVHWVNPDASALSRLASGQSRFPLWKVAVLIGLLALMLESFLLIGRAGGRAAGPPQ